MSNYALAADVRNRLDGTGLTDELIKDMTKTTNTTTQSSYLEFLLVNACGLIDAHLARFYTTPIVSDQSNGFLREITLDLAEYDLYKRALGDDVPAKIKYAMDRAMVLLKMIADGTLTPFVTNAINSSIDVSSDTAVMNEDSLEVF